jgi:hypothetical protein
MRAIVITCVCSLLSASASGQTGASIDTLLRLSFADRADALLRVRGSDGGLAALHDLELTAHRHADARRARGEPPLSEGCLSAAEFELDAQLKLARQAADADEFTAALREFTVMAAKLDSKLADARRTNDWKRQFPPLRHWEREWRAAKDPRARELFLRTLNGQAIRVALVRHKAPAVRAVAKGERPRVRAEDWTALADNSYREYIFNLMCANDEENLRWFKRQVAELGWFGQKEYGWAADQAALLIAQHADADLGFQESVVAALWPRLASNDTDPGNFAYLVDRVAVHARRPQTFGTQMECVNGEWIVPEIQDHSTLDDRRKRMNLVAYDVQLARIRGMCRN